jgi:2'-hydroxyisoflavone reductase
LRGIADTVGSEAELTWVDDAFLLEREVEPWTELPLWMPPGQGADHAWDIEAEAAHGAGFTTRPILHTVRDTWAWMQRDDVRPTDDDGRFKNNGIAPAKEQQILADWRSR